MDLHTNSLGEYYALPMTDSFKTQPITKTLLSTPSKLDGYSPRNQKLRTYPYCYLGYNPTNGSSKIYRYEDFDNGTPAFNMISEINPNPTVNFIPLNYRGLSENTQDAVALNGYPTISHKTDVYNTWLAQNSEIISLNMQQEQKIYDIDTAQRNIGSSASVAGQALSFNFGGAISTASNTPFEQARNDINHEYFIKNQLAQIEKQKLLPDTASLSSSNATMLGYGLMDNNIFSRYTIKKQFAKRIDDFFDMYGYLTNELKIPNLTNRPNWNYIKTIGCNIIGDIPEEALITIKNLFDTGITLWHNPNTFLDYSQNNR